MSVAVCGTLGQNVSLYVVTFIAQSCACSSNFLSRSPDVHIVGIARLAVFGKTPSDSLFIGIEVCQRIPNIRNRIRDSINVAWDWRVSLRQHGSLGLLAREFALLQIARGC